MEINFPGQINDSCRKLCFRIYGVLNLMVFAGGRKDILGTRTECMRVQKQEWMGFATNDTLVIANLKNPLAASPMGLIYVKSERSRR